jgi:hypothetical protein
MRHAITSAIATPMALIVHPAVVMPTGYPPLEGSARDGRPFLRPPARPWRDGDLDAARLLAVRRGAIP